MKKNLLPLISFIAGIALIVWSITSSGEISSFLDGPSLIITLGGSFCALLISFPFKDIKKVPALLKQLFSLTEEDTAGFIETVVDLSRKSRSQGILAIEEEVEQLDNEMLAFGLSMVVDGVESEDLKEILEIKADNIEQRHNIGHEIFAKWGELAPGFGMLGTLIGLIIMLGQLNDPSTIGSGMATALITTFYGSLLANLVFLPVATNLKMQTEEEMQRCEMAIEAVLSIQAGQNPRTIEQKLSSYLSKSAEESRQKATEEISQQKEEHYV